MVPSNRDEFREYCLRALGKPVLQINVEDTQVEDRIDEALYMYQQFHMDAVEKTFLKHQITASHVTFAVPSTGSFIINERFHTTDNTVIGVITSANSTACEFYTLSGTLDTGATLTGVQSGATAIANTVVLGDMDNKYIPIPDPVISVTRVFPPFESRLGGEILFDPQAQFSISLLSNFTSNSMIPYVVGRQYLQMVNDLLRGRPSMRFQRHMNRLHIDINWAGLLRPNQYLVVECFRVIDPETFTDIWSDRWLQRYATALLRRQWGINLSKYSGVTLPGGVTLDGKSMYTEAIQEIKDLELELQNTFQLPIDFTIG